MDSPNNSSNIPSNEQIVSDITTDFIEKLNIESNDNETKGENTTKQNLDNPLVNSDAPEDFENSDSEEPKDVIPDDFIDEEKLKDLDLTLSDEEKLERRKEALNHKGQGNDEFKQGNYLESIRSYTEGLRICPLDFESDRAVLYANRGASKAKLDRKESAIEDCTKALELNSSYVKAYLRRAKLYEETDKLDESLADYNKIVELDPGNRDAVTAQVRLPPMINEKNEKLKEEMLGKLKDLGNVILRPFGLSTDNFKLTQDPNSGGYSVNFTQGTK